MKQKTNVFTYSITNLPPPQKKDNQKQEKR